MVLFLEHLTQFLCISVIFTNCTYLTLTKHDFNYVKRQCVVVIYINYNLIPLDQIDLIVNKYFIIASIHIFVGEFHL